MSKKVLDVGVDSARSWALIDLSALINNFHALQRLTGVPVIAVVKASAYGHGAVPVAQALSRAGARMLAVVCMEEALELRHAGIRTPVLLLSEPWGRGRTSLDEIEEGIMSQVHFGVYTMSFLESLATAAEKLEKIASVHIKVDTGMHRLGALPHEAIKILKSALCQDFLEVGGLWTHLAVADDPTDSFTNDQLDKFDQFLAEARTILRKQRKHIPVIVHAANSAAALAFPRSRFDMVRSGICLYGERPAPGFALPDKFVLQPVLQWTSRVSLVKEVVPGSRPSYGRTRAIQGSKLAVVPVGYADGYMRALSNVADVLIGGRRHRIAGAVTMDHIIIECSEEEGFGHEVRPGDEVVLIGSQGNEVISATELAQKAGTIVYEVLTRVGKRVKRVYVQ